MTVLIKGIEMPIEGEAVVLVLSNENGKTMAEVDEYCGAVYEAVPVPAPHGRLVDADAFIVDQCHSCDGWCDNCSCDCLNCKSEHRCNIMLDFEDMPTIVEAEEFDNG